jgi:hypothetical protein
VPWSPWADLIGRRSLPKGRHSLGPQNSWLIYCGISHEATRDPKLNDEAKTPGSGMATPKGDDEAPNG